MRETNDYNYQQVHDQRFAESIYVAAIVKVLAFDQSKMTVNVQPLSKRLEHGSYESQPPILQVPVALTHCGGFVFRPWFKTGDVGVVIYLDHDIDASISQGDETKPLTERNHSPSDAIFIGAVIAGGYVMPELPSESIVLSSDDGYSYVAVTKDNVILKTGDVTVEASDASGSIIFSTKGGGGYMSLSGDSVTMKGKAVSIESTGVVNIKGSSVNIKGSTVNLN